MNNKIINTSSINLLLLMLLLLVFIHKTKGESALLKQSSKLNNDSLTKFQKFNKKAEKLFKFLPVPVSSYSNETGSVFGLAKYNLVSLVKSDTISSPSKFNELISASAKDQYKIIVGSNIYLKKNKIHLKGEVNYIKFPEYFSGIGNDSRDKILEEVEIEKISFNNSFLLGSNKKNTLYIGIHQQYANFLAVEKIYRALSEKSNTITQIEYPGHKSGILSGIGIVINYDNRDNRYNAEKGYYLATSYIVNANFLGSSYNLNTYTLDVRKYFNPFKNQVLAMQFYLESNFGEVPFYSLAMMGGGNRMRGYYLGNIRDKLASDVQLEYRAHIWSIFGLTAFASAGRVADKPSSLSYKNLWYASGIGLRIMVDKKSKANLRVDFGVGKNSRAIIIGFTEAF